MSQCAKYQNCTHDPITAGIPVTVTNPNSVSLKVKCEFFRLAVTAMVTGISGVKALKYGSKASVEAAFEHLLARSLVRIVT
jgi:hypothetical protein